jgi:hypothetical protein
VSKACRFPEGARAATIHRPLALLLLLLLLLQQDVLSTPFGGMLAGMINANNPMQSRFGAPGATLDPFRCACEVGERGPLL